MAQAESVNSMPVSPACTPGGPESGKKIQIWKIFGEI
jgi:hypothetical protein